MEFRTIVPLGKTNLSISHKDPLLLLGSCFTENIGNKLIENKFPANLNPFGILYNPASILKAITLLIKPQEFTPAHLIEHEGLFHSFMHHSNFSSASPTECLVTINNRLTTGAASLKKASVLLITFGTAYIYTLKETGEIVANCHKLPERYFNRTLLTVKEIVSDWEELLKNVWEYNPELKILYTVSPIRHLKDGAHGNQISKATLLLAIDELIKLNPEQSFYFPAYEIMLDELRDYRFYTEDMVHPSGLAIAYIWEQFSSHFFSPEAKEILHHWQEIRKAIQHKPFQPASEAYKRFIYQTLLKMERLYEKFPYFDIEKEIVQLRSKISE
ncbi:MAG: GSCFA domain-containing protein [Tannerellaceae bacterium]|nr:GSCFA domain-containing protein [Tannerellaceae bacterium]